MGIFNSIKKKYVPTLLFTVVLMRWHFHKCNLVLGFSYLFISDIKEVVGQENRCRRFLDELEADIKLIINIHIKENHVVRKENKSTFYDILSAYLAIKTTLFFGPITSSGDCFRIEWDFNWPVGFDCEDTLYYCRVVLDQNGVIKTAYPIKYSQMCNM
jgi:hypothetical protein